MLSKALKITLTTAVLTVAFIGLLWTTMADGTAYYMHVDEVMVEPKAWHGKRLQVHGYAEDIGVRRKTVSPTPGFGVWQAAHSSVYSHDGRD